MRKFISNFVCVFISLRIADAVSIAAGMWFVPKYVSSAEIGTLLPLTSFATFLSIPLFAFATTAMKEAVPLYASGDYGKLNSMLRAVFGISVAMAAVAFGCAALLIPHFSDAVGGCSNAVKYIALCAALMGCASPVFTDAVQAMKRFVALGAIEIFSSAVRFVVMIAFMPSCALLGYFAAQLSQPFARMVLSVSFLKSALSVECSEFWTRPAVKRFVKYFLLILLYQSLPVLASFIEQCVVRICLGEIDSAGYYMVTRFSDFLYYLTLPLLIVLFPYTALSGSAPQRNRFVVFASALTGAVALIACMLYIFWGRDILSLLPGGGDYAGYSYMMPHLVIATALTSVQVFYTNSEISAGRFKFLKWFIPLHAIYVLLLSVMAKCGKIEDCNDFLRCLYAVSAARFIFTFAAIRSKRIS